MGQNEINIEDVINDTAKRVIAEIAVFPQCMIEQNILENVRKLVETNAVNIKELDNDIRGNGREGLRSMQARTDLEFKSFKKTVEDFMKDVKKLGWALILLLLSLLGTSLYNILIIHPVN